ncbi:MAG: lysyl oxidase family protein, partial [Candidatus Sumerlaeaceae bacterium]
LPGPKQIAAQGNPFVSPEDYYMTSCAVEGGCTLAGRRRLLRFAAYTQNVGASDLSLGSPVGNPMFEFHACHGHYHFEEYLNIRLLTTTGTVVAGRKQSFCILDSVRHNSSAPAAPLYHCANQGMQAGWGDIYTAGLDCQYVDITGVPPGSYVLELHVNPLQILAEASYANNVSTVSVTIPALAPVPQNDLCTSATSVAIVGVPFTGSTMEASDDGDGCGASSNSHDVWFRYIPSGSGTATFASCLSGYDTVISIHSGCPGTLANMLACNDDSTGAGCGGTDQSEISLSVTQGNTYMIRVAGFLSSQGSYRLVVNGPGAVSAVETWQLYN